MDLSEALAEAVKVDNETLARCLETEADFLVRNYSTEVVHAATYMEAAKRLRAMNYTGDEHGKC